MEAVVTTPSVVTVNVADAAPAGTVTDAGTVAFVVSELVSATLIPPVFALPFSVMVPVEGAPAMTDVGLSDRLVMAGGLTVRLMMETPRTGVATSPTLLVDAIV